jgi:hypothetical protein
MFCVILQNIIKLLLQNKCKIIKILKVYVTNFGNVESTQISEKLYRKIM